MNKTSRNMAYSSVSTGKDAILKGSSNLNTDRKLKVDSKPTSKMMSPVRAALKDSNQAKSHGTGEKKIGKKGGPSKASISTFDLSQKITEGTSPAKRPSPKIEDENDGSRDPEYGYKMKFVNKSCGDKMFPFEREEIKKYDKRIFYLDWAKVRDVQTSAMGKESDLEDLSEEKVDGEEQKK